MNGSEGDGKAHGGKDSADLCRGLCSTSIVLSSKRQAASVAPQCGLVRREASGSASASLAPVRARGAALLESRECL